MSFGGAGPGEQSRAGVLGLDALPQPGGHRQRAAADPVKDLQSFAVSRLNDGDTTMATKAEVLKLAGGGGARVDR